jgi:hypothetical protein
LDFSDLRGHIRHYLILLNVELEALVEGERGLFFLDGNMDYFLMEVHFVDRLLLYLLQKNIVYLYVFLNVLDVHHVFFLDEHILLTECVTTAGEPGVRYTALCRNQGIP